MATQEQLRKIGELTEAVRMAAEAGEDTAPLVADAEDFIRGTKPVREHQAHIKRVKAAAATPPAASTDLTTRDYHAIEGMDELVQTGVARVKDTVNAGASMADNFRKVAAILLEARLRMRNKDGLPDLIASGKATKNIATDIYTEAGKDIPADDVDRLAQHSAIAKNVRNHMTDVLVEYMRSLDNSPEHVQEMYPQAALRYPTLTPTEAVYKLYEDAGYAVTRVTRAERAAADTAKLKALASQAPQADNSPASADADVADLDRVSTAVTRAVRRRKQMTEEEREAWRTHIQSTITALAAAASKL